MAASSNKRTLDAFFVPAPKKRSAPQPTQGGKHAVPSPQDEERATFSTHFSYPFPIQDLPKSLLEAIIQLSDSSIKNPKIVNNQPHLDLIYYDPFIPRPLSQELFRFLRSSLPFYRVSYTITRGLIPTNIVTPRYTTVFGLDATSRFDEDGRPVDAATRTQLRREPEYTTIPPRPLPQSLEVLRKVTEKATGCTYNFCLVNYYASGSDSVAYHSDDERFLGENPAIASLSLGAKRDFLLKHKPVNGIQPFDTEVLKMPLGSGDMVLMRGKTQANWLHSIPKRAGAGTMDGRINITFRRGLSKYATENYFCYNTGTGSVYKWDERRREMKICEDREKEEIKLHRGPAMKFEGGMMAKSNDQHVKEEAKTGRRPLVKIEDAFKGSRNWVFTKQESDDVESQVHHKMEDDQDNAMKVGVATLGKVVKSESQPPVISHAEELQQDDEEEWEEKVRRDIEGEASISNVGGG